MNCFSQPSEEPDSISWAYEKISQGKQNESDTTFAITCFEQALMIGKKVNNNLLMERAFYRLGYQYSLAGLRKKTLYYSVNEQSSSSRCRRLGFPSSF